MTSSLQSFIGSISLITIGAVVAGWTGLKANNTQELDVPLNPLGINRSPYGSVFAIAMQGPINRDFHVGMYGNTPDEINQALIEEAKNKPSSEEPGSLLIVKPETQKESGDATSSPIQSEPGTLKRLEGIINKMRVGHIERTNPLPASPALKFYLRRKAEDKLRFAYNLDPSHYANYAALHFFLAEGITTRPEKAKFSRELARETIDYCLSIDHDPRPALTAAAACTNILHIMFKADRIGAQKQYSTDEMSAILKELDSSIAKYHRLASDWDKNGNWMRISPQRIQDCERRISFITNIRNAAEKTIERIHHTYAN